MEQRWIPKLGARIIRIQTEQHYIINKVEKHFLKKEVKYHLKQEDGPVDLIVRYDELKTLFRPIKQTNADRIRSMTDEELAEMLSTVSQHCVVYLSDRINCRHSNCDTSCKNNIKKWLRAESEEKHGE